MEETITKITKPINDEELLKIFPGVKAMIPSKIVELERKRNELLNTIKEWLTFIKQEVYDEFSQWFWRKWVKINEGQELLRIETDIIRFKRLLYISMGRTQETKIAENKIQEALQIPIENLINTKLRRCGRALVGLCPLHKENNPSFYIYPETNSFWCFGCCKGGNVINFTRLIYGCSFKEAVNRLVRTNKYENE